MVKYLSGRQKLRPSDKLTEDRYQYLGLDQAEPNLADPATSPGVPSGLQYQLVAVTGYEGRRYWVPVGGSLQPGAITIFDEGTPVSSASSITQMNFVGAAVTAQVSLQNPSGHPGIAATVTVIPVTVGDSPPIGVGATNNGELWWESDTGDLYVYYNDGNSSQWVMANAGGRGLTGDKGAKGDKGQKGDTGLTGGAGQKGEVGEKGAPSTVAGPAGDKGQKGEIGAGDKGQKGEDGADGDKGQKGEIGVGTKGDKGDGSAGGASVTISDDAPSSPNNGDLWWESDTFDLHVYYQDGSSNQWVSITSNAALKGEKGDKGQKGEVGIKGQKGEIGDKGQKGEIGATGGTGGTGSKGQKGETGVGDKGQKGEIGATGGTGGAGDKGSTGEKGDKGAPSTVAGDKGQKGEIGATGSGGSAGADGDKGQKGEEGPQGGGAPVGQIVAWSGSAGSLPSGYFLCDGSAISRTTYAALFNVVGTTHGAGNGSSTFNIPDLRDRFILGASNSTGDTTYPGVSPGAKGGHTDATLVQHNHNISDPNHSHGINDPGHFHTTNDYVARSGYAEPRNFGVGTDGNANNTGNTNTKTTGISVNSNATGITINNEGVSGTNKNLPPYYALAYIIQYAQGGTTAKGQKGEVGAAGSGGSTGDKGQKGEAGDKGAASTVQGPAGDKGQKGEVGATGAGGSTGSAGAKGQKGEIGIGEKGQKGEIGATGSGGSAGAKGQKGEVGEKGQKGEGANVATQSNAPSSPVAGDLWWDTDDGDLHVYYNDGNTSQWVNTSGVGAKGQKGDEGASGNNDIRSANIAVSTGESNTSSYNFSDKVSLSINTTSTSRVLVHYAFEIKHSASNNVYCTGRVSGSIGITDMVGAVNQNLDFTESGSGYVRHNGSILDVSSYSGTRTYKIQFANGTQGGSSTGYSYIRNATLVITEITT